MNEHEEFNNHHIGTFEMEIYCIGVEINRDGKFYWFDCKSQS